MQQLTLRGYLTPHEIRIVISPYLAVPAIFPGRSSLQNVTSKSATLLEMFLNAHLLDDPQSLSAELSKETIKFKLRLRRMIPPWFACYDKWLEQHEECYLIYYLVVLMIKSFQYIHVDLTDILLPWHISKWVTWKIIIINLLLKVPWLPCERRETPSPSLSLVNERFIEVLQTISRYIQLISAYC